MNRFFCVLSLVFLIVISCSHERKNDLGKVKHRYQKKEHKEEIIVDCNYTYDEAIENSKAPDSVLSELKLINVRYYSVDGKIHAGQILTNERAVEKIQQLFEILLDEKFPVAHAVPVVKYNWNDDLSMQDNNTYSFCYRNIGYSRHARGMAIDINPYFNPVRWKKGYTFRQNKPVGATYDTSVPGTFVESSPVVIKFEKLGFRWGHTFSMKFDDHHFEL